MNHRRTTLVLVAALLAGCSANQSTASNATLETPTPTQPSPEAGAREEPDAQSAVIVDTGDAEVVTTPSAEPGALDAAVIADASAHDASSRDGATRPARTTQTTSTTSTTSSAATASAAATEARAIFDRTCGRCHPGGERRVGPRLAGRNDSEAHLREVVRNGDGTMRPIPASRLSDGDLAKVIVFLRSIRAVR
ncbi:MAG: cytochrome c [Polyangiales bacterium]